MRKSTKIVIGFAGVGFFLPLPFWVFQAAIASHSSGYLLTYLCPSSILSIVLWLDGPRPLFEVIVVWFIICASNAILYAAPAFALVIIYRVMRPDRQLDGLQLR